MDGRKEAVKNGRREGEKMDVQMEGRKDGWKNKRGMREERCIPKMGGRKQGWEE